MATVHTAHGEGKIIESETVRGRTQYKVAGDGFSVWLDETQVHEASEHEAAPNFDFEPSDHTWDNHTTLPYNPEPQFPVDMFRHEQTISPDHKIDIKERLRPSDSRSFETRDDEHEYPGPDPKLFAKGASHPDDDHFREWADDDEALVGNPRHDMNHPDYDPHYAPLEGYHGEDGPDDFHDSHRPGWEETPHDEYGFPSHEGRMHEDPMHPQYGTGSPALVHPAELEYDEPGNPDSVATLRRQEGTDYHPGEGRHFRPAGLDARYADIISEADHYNDPVQRFKDDPHTAIHRHGNIDISAGLDQETGEWMNLVEADKQIRTAAWKDVAQKASRLKREGAVHVKAMDPSAIYANVDGDNGNYEVMILRGSSYSGVSPVKKQAIADWKCSCPWGQWAFKRKLTFVGRLCFLPGTKVVMADSTLKPIEEVVEGDLVRSHTGEARKVTATILNHHDDLVYGVHPRGHETIWATGNHPFYVRPHTDIKCQDCWDKGYQRSLCATQGLRGTRGSMHDHKNLRGEKFNPQWVEAENLTTDYWLSKTAPKTAERTVVFDLTEFCEHHRQDEQGRIVRGIVRQTQVGTPLQYRGTPVYRHVKLDEDLAYLFGLYLGDGSHPRSGTVGFHFGLDEQHLVDEVTRIVGEKFGLTPQVHVRRSGRNIIDVFLTSAIVTEFFHRYVGSGHAVKRLAPEVLEAPASVLSHALRGWIDSDNACSVNRNLVFQMEQIALRNGMSCSVTTTPSASQGNDLVGYNVKDIYHLNCSPERDQRSQFFTNFVEGDTAWVRVQGVEQKHYHGPVFNLSVEGEESYQVNGINTHNCSHGYATYLTQQSHYMTDKAKRRKKSSRTAGADAFKSWCDKENGGHVDLNAADNYLSTKEEPVTKEEAQSVLDYVQTHHSEHPERDYDQDEYSNDPEDAYKGNNLHEAGTYGPYDVPESEEPSICPECSKHYVTPGYGHPEFEHDRHVTPGYENRHQADVLRHQPGKLTPHLYVVPEGEEEHFTDLGDDRKTTGPDQIMARVAKGEDIHDHHPDFAWHSPDESDFPEQGIVHFSQRKLALIYTADEDLLNKIRDLSQEQPSEHFQDCQKHNRELSEAVEEAIDRGYAAAPMVAMKRQAWWRSAAPSIVGPAGPTTPAPAGVSGEISGMAPGAGVPFAQRDPVSQKADAAMATLPKPAQNAGTAGAVSGGGGGAGSGGAAVGDAPAPAAAPAAPPAAPAGNPNQQPNGQYKPNAMGVMEGLGHDVLGIGQPGQEPSGQFAPTLKGVGEAIGHGIGDIGKSIGDFAGFGSPAKNDQGQYNPTLKGVGEDVVDLDNPGRTSSRHFTAAMGPPTGGEDPHWSGTGPGPGASNTWGGGHGYAGAGAGLGQDWKASNETTHIPSGSYTVKPGDTASGIAERAGVPLSQLTGLGSNPDLITPGQQIGASRRFAHRYFYGIETPGLGIAGDATDKFKGGTEGKPTPAGSGFGLKDLTKGVTAQRWAKRYFFADDDDDGPPSDLVGDAGDSKGAGDPDPQHHQQSGASGPSHDQAPGPGVPNVAQDQPSPGPGNHPPGSDRPQNRGNEYLQVGPHAPGGGPQSGGVAHGDLLPAGYQGAITGQPQVGPVSNFPKDQQNPQLGPQPVSQSPYSAPLPAPAPGVPPPPVGGQFGGGSGLGGLGGGGMGNVMSELGGLLGGGGLNSLLGGGGGGGFHLPSMGGGGGGGGGGRGFHGSAQHFAEHYWSQGDDHRWHDEHGLESGRGARFSELRANGWSQDSQGKWHKNAAGDFMGDGGGDWADYAFAGSGPDRQEWSSTSEDYVDEHERPHHHDKWMTDDSGDIIDYDKGRPQQRPKQSSRHQAGALEEPHKVVLSDESGQPVQTKDFPDGHSAIITLQGNGYNHEGNGHWSHPLGKSADIPQWHPKQAQRFAQQYFQADMGGSGDAGYGASPVHTHGGGFVHTEGSGMAGGHGVMHAESSGGSAPTMGELHNASVSESSRQFWADALPNTGYFNPNNPGAPHPEEQPQSKGPNKRKNPGGLPKNPGGPASPEAAEAAGAGGIAAEAGPAIAEAAPLLLTTSREDDSDVVRRFHASGGGCLGNDSGGFSDDAIASQAQGFLRTAGRHYTLREQRELEDEFSARGARNLSSLDLTGTHYLDDE